MDTEFDDLQPGSIATVLRASSIPSVAESSKPSPRQPNASSKPQVTDQDLKKGHFAEIYQQFLNEPGKAGQSGLDDDEEDMVGGDDLADNDDDNDDDDDIFGH